MKTTIFRKAAMAALITIAAGSSVLAQSSTGLANKMKVEAEKYLKGKGITLTSPDDKTCDGSKGVSYIQVMGNPGTPDGVSATETTIGVAVWQADGGTMQTLEVKVRNTGGELYFTGYEAGGSAAGTVYAKQAPFGPPIGVKSCKAVDASNAAILAAAQAQANSICQKVYRCLPMCIDGIVVGYALYVIFPSSPPCPIIWHNDTEFLSAAKVFDEVVSVYVSNLEVK